MSSEELSKMSKEILSKDLAFENPRPEEEIADDIKWDIEDMKRSIIDAAEQSWDEFAGG